jgi:hypothetical protein
VEFQTWEAKRRGKSGKLVILAAGTILGKKGEEEGKHRDTGGTEGVNISRDFAVFLFV